jgi:hypothetical protein
MANHRLKNSKTARELECDDDELRFKDRLRKLVKHQPAKKRD